jgi:deazaflavin-dependent oxidoreductase (nitroreductase family)
VSRTFFWKMDPVLLRISRGRLRSGLVIPVGVLETRGARTRAIRRRAIIYFHDGDRVTIVASNAGAPENPSWYFNALADPEVTFGGHPFRAEVVGDEAERARLWALADRVCPPYAAFRERAARAGRSMPILQLLAR